MIIYALSAGGNISIADLFTAGIIPGLLLAAALMRHGLSRRGQTRLSNRAIPRLQEGSAIISSISIRA